MDGMANIVPDFDAVEHAYLPFVRSEVNMQLLQAMLKPNALENEIFSYHTKWL